MKTLEELVHEPILRQGHKHDLIEPMTEYDYVRLKVRAMPQDDFLEVLSDALQEWGEARGLSNFD